MIYKFTPSNEYPQDIMHYFKTDRFRTDFVRNSFRYERSVLWDVLPLKQTQEVQLTILNMQWEIL